MVLALRLLEERLSPAANSRFYTLNLVDENNVPVNDAVRLIGTDGGLLPAPAQLPATGLTVAPAERFDVLIDFSRFKGQKLKLRNADPRLGGIEPDLMEFRVDGRAKHDSFTLPEKVSTSYQRLVHGSTLRVSARLGWNCYICGARSNS